MIKARKLTHIQESLRKLWKCLNSREFIDLAKKATSRSINQWLDFSEIPIRNSKLLEMLTIGFEMIFLGDEKLKEKFRSLVDCPKMQ